MTTTDRLRQDTVESIAEDLAVEYAAARPKSKALAKRQEALVPAGVTHTARAFSPFPLFVEACRGSHKWDVDGHEYIDYWMGHGSFLLGHAHPMVNAAIEAQLGNGLHAGGETEVGLQWAEAVCRLVPSAERVRFTSSGGEATQMALRVARAYSGRPKVLKFRHHFHGWHDGVATGVTAPWDIPFGPGVSPGALEDTVVVPSNDIGAVRDVAEQGDLAAVILEPGGGFSDTVPSEATFVRELRELTREAGVVLIFDEVVTGFRYAPGGFQEYIGILPDLTTLGKIVAGGLPAGALAGAEDMMDVLGTTGDPELDRRERITQYGTWNAMPVAAAAGVATLELVGTGEPTEIARQRADQLREQLNALFEQLSLPAGAYGRSSIWKTFMGERPRILDGDLSNAEADGERLAQGWGDITAPLRTALLARGVDPMRTAGFTSSAHSEDDISRTTEAFEWAVKRLRADGILRD